MGNARNIAFWVVLFLLVWALFNLFSGSSGSLQSREISFSDFVSSVQDGGVSQVTLDGEQIETLISGDGPLAFDHDNERLYYAAHSATASPVPTSNA